jgi:hypothetical protein
MDIKNFFLGKLWHWLALGLCSMRHCVIALIAPLAKKFGWIGDISNHPSPVASANFLASGAMSANLALTDTTIFSKKKFDIHPTSEHLPRGLNLNQQR